MKNVLVFGNPLVKKDNLILRILPKLQNFFPNINFIHLDPTENIEQYGPNLIIIDVFVGIKEPITLTSLDKLILPNINSMHDFDLGYNLKLLMSVGKIKEVLIFGIPYDMNEEKALRWLKEKLNSFLN